jgi:hypothetical protein
MQTKPTRWRRDWLSFFTEVLTLPGGRSYGANLDEFQIEDFSRLFAASSKSALWERPRGHSKTEDSAAVALHHILTVPGARAYAAATDQAQAGLVHDSLSGFIRRSELLSASLDVQRNRIVARSTGSTLEILASDSAGSWGLRPSLVLIDELAAWRGTNAESFLQALLSSLGKVAGARAIIATTAGWDRNGIAWRLREQVAADDSWIFSRRGQCASWVSPTFLEQQRRLLPAHVFQMLHLNEWTEAGGAFLTWAEIDAVFGPDLQPGSRPTQPAARYIGLDLAVAHDRTALAVCRNASGLCVVEELETWQGSPSNRVELSEVEEATANIALRIGAPVILDAWQGLLMAERLRARGVQTWVQQFTQQSRTKLYDTLLLLIREKRLRSFEHELFREELLGLRWVDKGGSLRPDHPVDGHDDIAIAVGLAAQGIVQQDLVEKRPKRKPRASTNVGGKSSRILRDDTAWKAPSIII